MSVPERTTVYVTDASDREVAIRTILGKLDISNLRNASVAIKANFNSADPYPASTHIDTLRFLMREIQNEKPEDLVLAERSGMGDTRTVLDRSGVFALSRELGFRVMVLDEIGGDGWNDVSCQGLHWSNGFKIARIFTEADTVIQTCCLKTHRFGGHFTLSLKNSVGLVAKSVPGGSYDYMRELHTSPHQRLMIAEINKHYPVHGIILDATEGFVDGGPDRGTRINPNIIIGGTDRVAVDAAGVALLRSYGSTRNVMHGRIFEQEQIARAAELKVGIKDASAIHLSCLDDRAEGITLKIQDILDREG